MASYPRGMSPPLVGGQRRLGDLSGGSMIRHRKFGLATVAGAVAACTFGLPAAPAQAAAAPSHQRTSFPAAGAVFDCAGGQLTVTEGTIYMLEQSVVDAQGVLHITGTVTVHGVKLQDADQNAYTLSGASSFAVKSVGAPEEGGVLVATDTTTFVIRHAHGGVFGKVRTFEHLSPNGKVISFDFGACEAPTG